MKKVILCPNPYRDKGLAAAKEAEGILQSVGLETVYCLPFKPEGGEGQFGVACRRCSRSCAPPTSSSPSAGTAPSSTWPGPPPCGAFPCWG